MVLAPLAARIYFRCGTHRSCFVVPTVPGQARTISGFHETDLVSILSLVPFFNSNPPSQPHSVNLLALRNPDLSLCHRLRLPADLVLPHQVKASENRWPAPPAALPEGFYGMARARDVPQRIVSRRLMCCCDS